MPEKGNSKRPRKHKSAAGLHSQHVRREPLTEVQKILIGNGGMGHKYLRAGSDRFRFSTNPKRRGGRSAKEAS